MNVNKYKIFIKIAKGMLAMQISTIISEFAFLFSGQILDFFSNLLNTNMVEEETYLKNWLHNNKEPIVVCHYLNKITALKDSQKNL